MTNDRGDELEVPEAEEELEGLESEEPEGEGEEELEGEEVEAQSGEEESVEDEKLREKLEREKNIRIPKARFDEVRRKSKEKIDALQSRIDELEASKNISTDVKKLLTGRNDLQNKYEDLLLDNKRDEARKVRAQLDQINDQIVEMKAAQFSEHSRTAAINQLKYEETLATLEAQYPELNPDLEEAFDAETAEEVATLTEALQTRGFQPAVALRKAARYVLGEARETKRDTKQAAKTGLKRRNKMPPDLTKAGRAADKSGKLASASNILRMKPEDLNSMEKKDISRLRGDFL